MQIEEPPSPLGRKALHLTRRISVILNSIPRRLPALIPVCVAIFLTTAFSADLYAAYQLRVTPQSVNDAERVAFTLSNYLQLDTLRAAETEDDLASISFAGQNTGGLATSVPDSLREHTVQKGETLTSIASTYGLRMGSIILANKDIDIDLLKEKDKITIPNVDASDADLDKEWAERQQKQDKVVAKKVTEKKASVATSVKAVATSSSRKLRHPMPGLNYTSQGFSLSHPGKDYAGPQGTPLYAVDDGCVVIAGSGWNGGYGNRVVLNIGGGVTVLYAHMKSFVKGISAGDCFEAGDIIGYSGNTGRSTGPHLHFEVRVNGVPRNPGNYGI
ncbi:MAG TPA: LysM peptidoglycan-binding domain-containing M23 family metallopeptidase [Verrucomicrobiae bacterium]|nr:LysM peptidoglycan-binding domain-containing M23 family metallopeptidase [Verrucomicrobiae bacterium]